MCHCVARTGLSVKGDFALCDWAQLRAPGPGTDSGGWAPEPAYAGGRGGFPNSPVCPSKLRDVKGEPVRRVNLPLPVFSFPESDVASPPSLMPSLRRDDLFRNV